MSRSRSKAKSKDVGPSSAAAQLALARTRQDAGETDAALRLADECLCQSLKGRLPLVELKVQVLRSELLCELGRTDEAEASAQRALELAWKMRLEDQKVLCAISLGRILVESGRRKGLKTLNRARQMALDNFPDYAKAAEELIRRVSK